MAEVVIILYTLSLLFLFLFSLGQLHLVWHYLRSLKKKGAEVPLTFAENPPFVTIQLPVYNERYVAARLLDAIATIDYPTQKLEIQVLDDSTDDTGCIIENKIPELQRLRPELIIHHLRRKNREGYKAGALQEALPIAKGEYIAIFDADFIPEPDFLKKTIPYFSDPRTGVVQTRWGHLNRDYSLFTKLQAFGLDAHFTVEQGGRSNAGSFINFNGTGGIWRKSCILDAGGWSADTLTEDLDLSYRAQLKGWKFRYLEEVEAPAELPVLMPAIKSQHFRWNKGAAECARKNLGKVFSSPEKATLKVHALLHLLNSSIFPAIFLSALLSVPVLFIKISHPGFNWLFQFSSIFLVGFLSIGIFYMVSAQRIYPDKSGRYFWSLFPPFLVLCMGLSAHNTLAVAEGWLGIKSPFLRTPKFNIRQKNDSWKGNIYIRKDLSGLNLLEGILALYFVFGMGAAIYFLDFWMLFYYSLLALGFGVVFYYSVR